MPAYDRHPADDALLVRYLTGVLRDEEAEPIEKASVTDEEFAARLAAVENDLVDAYVRGELDPETAARFEAWYLASDARRRKVAVARALAERGAAHRASVTAVHSRRAWWTLAAAALLIAVLSYTFVARRPPAVTEPARTSVPTATEQLAEGDPTPSTGLPAPAAETEPPRGPSAVPGVAVLLRPATRSTADVPAVVIPAGATAVRVRLQLELDDFSRYECVLRPAGSDDVLWRSGSMRAASDSSGSFLTVDLPAERLGPRNYSVELFGKDHGETEYISSYAFRAVLDARSAR